MTITNPNDLSGITCWLDAQQHSASDNDPVATATDYHTGGGNDFTAADAARPLYKINIYNNHPIFRFDGTDNLMSNSSFTLSQPFTIGIFYAHRAGSVSGLQILLGGSSNNFGFWIEDASPDIISITCNGGTNKVSKNLDANYNYAVGVFDGASSLLRINGSEATGSVGSGGYGTGVLGAGSGSSFLSGVDVGEVVLCSGALSAGSITDLEAYFTAHWAAAVVPIVTSQYRRRRN